MTPSALARLTLTLDAEATPGPWFDDAAIGGDGSVVMSEKTGFRLAHLPETANVHNHAADAAYIALARACPDLARAYLALVAALRVLDEEHGDRCRFRLFLGVMPAEPCTCGLTARQDAARAVVAAATGEGE